MHFTQTVPAQWALKIVHPLNGRWYGHYGTCRCPAHEDENPSLSVRARRTAVLVKCHARCEADDVIRALAKRNLWPRFKAIYFPRPTSVRSYSLPDTSSQAVTWLWDQALPITATPAKRYRMHRYFTHIRSPELRFLLEAKPSPTLKNGRGFHKKAPVGTTVIGYKLGSVGTAGLYTVFQRETTYRCLIYVSVLTVFHLMPNSRFETWMASAVYKTCLAD